jgi:hypothetical protein
MAVELAPSTEAMQAIVLRINGGEYALPFAADYGESMIDIMEDIRALRVDVIAESEQQLNETLTLEDPTSHLIRVWIRRRVNPDDGNVDKLKLIVRQIYQRLNDFDSADGRVRVWELDMDSKQVPDKSMLASNHVFIASMLMRIEVEPS